MFQWSRRQGNGTAPQNTKPTPSIILRVAAAHRDIRQTSLFGGVLAWGLLMLTVHDIPSYVAVTATIIGFVWSLVRVYIRVVRLEWEFEKHKEVHTKLDLIPEQLVGIQASVSLVTAALAKLEGLPGALATLAASVHECQALEKSRHETEFNLRREKP